MRGLAAAKLGLAAFGAVSASGEEAEWGEKHLVAPPPMWSAQGHAKLFARFAKNTYWFKVKPIDGMQVDESTIYFNTDQDESTNGSEMNTEQPKGYESYAFVTLEGVELYQGCAPYMGEHCRTKIQQLDSKVLSDGSVEFKIIKKRFGRVKDIDIAVVLQSRPLNGGDAVVDIFPQYLLNYVTLYQDLDDLLDSTCTSTGNKNRVAVVYDVNSRDAHFDDLAYVQLLLSMQHQARQAGMPVDIISTSTVLKVSKACKYTALILPALSTVDPKQFYALRKALFVLLHVHGVGMLLAGQFMVQLSNGRLAYGDPYNSLKFLFGVSNHNPVAAMSATIELRVESEPELFWDKEKGALVADSSTLGFFAQIFEPVPKPAFTYHTAATQNLTIQGETQVLPSILLHELEAPNLFGRTSGRVVHFSSEMFLGSVDLGWRALVWIAKRDKPIHVALQLTRFDGGIFTCRNDVDQSKYKDQAPLLEEAVLEMAYKPWYEKYGFVASNYINVGNAPKLGETTNWTWAKRAYGEYEAIEHEIGSHSYTHPNVINDLSNSELKFEFKTAMAKIKSKLRLKRIASAQPGNPNNLRVAGVMEKYHASTYFSGGYSGFGAGSPGAFGRLSPTSKMIYVAPNLQFDFSLQILGYSPDQMEARWKANIDKLLAFASSQVFHWPIHDYAILDFNFERNELGTQGDYETHAFENTIAYARDKGVEFITTMQLSDRIRSFDRATLETQAMGPSTVRVVAGISKIVPGITTLGYEALKFSGASSGAYVVSVDNYYAYNTNKVLLPARGGTFDITYGSKDMAESNAFASTHISWLDMRMELRKVSGDGSSLKFTVFGKGSVTVLQRHDLDQFWTVVSQSDGTVSEDWSTTETRSLVFTFDTVKQHSVSIARDSSYGRKISQCSAACQGGVRWSGMGVDAESVCRYVTDFSGLRDENCGCDLSTPGALDEDSIDLAIACPQKYMKEPETFLETCSWLCGSEPSCDRWTFSQTDRTCYLLTCNGHSPILYAEDPTWVSGVPCRRDDDSR